MANECDLPGVAARMKAKGSPRLGDGLPLAQ